MDGGNHGYYPGWSETMLSSTELEVKGLAIDPFLAFRASQCHLIEG
jgi:hypothetical protein